jgi:hypothetical protein
MAKWVSSSARGGDLQSALDALGALPMPCNYRTTARAVRFLVGSRRVEAGSSDKPEPIGSAAR